MLDSDKKHPTSRLQALPLPLEQFPYLEVARFTASRSFLRDYLGEPHYVETDGLRTASGGEQDFWGFQASTGQRLALVLHEPVNICTILADPPDVPSALRVLTPILGSEPVYVLEEPFSWKNW